MEKASSSPERPSVKVTYLDRQKRKRKIAETTDPATPDLSSPNTPTTPKGKGGKMMKIATISTPESRLSSLTDTQSSEPAAKRARRNSDESVKSTTLAKTKNTRTGTASSNSLSRAEVQTNVKPVSTATMKPPSVVSRKRSPSQQPDTLESDADDGASIADSTISMGRIRRSEVQRIEYFKNEPLCGALTKDSAECKRCGKSVRLGNRTTYRIRPWEMHRVKCDHTPVATNDGAEDEVEKSKQRAKTVEQRIAILTADPAISSLKPHEVLCRNCGTWIRLSTNIPYKIANWKAHTLTCQAPVNHQPSDRVAAAARKLRLVNDSQVKSYTEHAVVCAYCNSTITSNAEDKDKGEHNLLDWEQHKIVCTRPSSISPKIKKAAVPTSEVSTVPFPARPPHSSASTVSTQATLVVPETKLNAGTKRLREEEETLDGGPPGNSDARPANRARTEIQQVGSDESTSAATWLALPFQAFIRGFKESLTR